MLKSADIAFGSAKPKIRDIVSKRVAIVQPQDGFDANRGRISFIIPPSNTELISSNFQLHLIFTILDAAGAALAPGVNIAMQTFPLASLFCDQELKASIIQLSLVCIKPYVS